MHIDRRKGNNTHRRTWRSNGTISTKMHWGTTVDTRTLGQLTFFHGQLSIVDLIGTVVDSGELDVHWSARPDNSKSMQAILALSVGKS